MAAIAMVATAAMAARVAISQSVASASTVDTLSGQVANSLATQNDFNSQFIKEYHGYICNWFWFKTTAKVTT